MNILIVYCEPTIMQLLQTVLELEGYMVVITQSAAEAVHTIEDNNDIVVLFADNIIFNRAAHEAIAILRDRPDVRQRVKTIAIDITTNHHVIQEQLHDVMADFLPMPFTPDPLLHIVEKHTKRPPR